MIEELNGKINDIVNSCENFKEQTSSIKELREAEKNRNIKLYLLFKDFFENNHK